MRGEVSELIFFKVSVEVSELTFLIVSDEVRKLTKNVSGQWSEVHETWFSGFRSAVGKK